MDSQAKDVCRGRGVKTRGGQGSRLLSGERSDSHTPRMEVEPVTTTRGRVLERGMRGRGRGAGLERGRLDPVDQPHLQQINDLPREMPLESRLHPKKRRLWNPENSNAASVEVEEVRVTVEPLAPLPALVVFPLNDTQDAAPSHSSVPPTPILFVECGDSSAATTPSSSRVKRTPPSHSRKPLTEDDIYGSESSGSEEEDETLVPFLLPRVYQQSLDTPIDPEPTAEEALQPPTALPLPPDTSDTLSEEYGVIGRGPSVQPELAMLSDVSMNPIDPFHFEWSPFPDPAIPSHERREKFTQEHVGPTVPCHDPYQIFTSIWDQGIMDHIVKETNRYAEHLVSSRFKNNSLSPHSRINFWQDTCVDEMYTYFAITLAMGIVIKKQIEEYWSKDGAIFATPGFHAHMVLRRYQLLTTCLHFNNNRDMCAQKLSPAEAKLFKIQPIINHLNNKFQAMYTLSQNIALDESLIRWKGWLSDNQFISNEVAKVGVKSYELCESQTGYLWRFIVHAHKRVVPQAQESPLEASTPSIVLELLRGLEGKGYTVFMDDYYNSPALARWLKSQGIDVVGTLRTNRQFVPRQLQEFTKANMRPGQIAGFTSGDVDVLVWRDENRVATISTYHGNKTSVVDGKVKPCVVVDYNIMMGGVDKKDQHLAMYPIEKRSKVWYQIFFRRLLNVSVLNSFIICNKSSSRTIQHRNFRISLINSLLDRHGKPHKTPPTKPPTNFFEAKAHYILEQPIGANKSRLRRKCCICKNLTHYYCAGCEKSVCIGPCFVTLHS